MDYSKLKLLELKVLCKEKGLAISGSKSILINRLSGTSISVVEKKVKKQVDVIVKEKKVKEKKIKETKSSKVDGIEVQLETKTIVEPPKKKQKLVKPISKVIPSTSTTPITSTEASIPTTQLDSSTIKSTPQVSTTPFKSISKSIQSTSRLSILPILSTSTSESISTLVSTTASIDTFAVIPLPKKVITKFKTPLLSSSIRPLQQKVENTQVKRSKHPNRTRIEIEKFYNKVLSALDPSNSQTLPISSNLYSTDEKFIIAVRFIINRIHTLLSQDATIEYILRQPLIGTVDRIVDGIVKLKLEDGSEIFILEETGEILGRENDGNLKGNLKIRVDWQNYIEEIRDGEREGKKRIVEYIKTSNEDDYNRGMSYRLNSLDKDDEEVVLVERFLLANLMPNAIAGKYTSIQNQSKINSEQDFTNSKLTKNELNLFSFHEIESIKIKEDIYLVTTSKGRTWFALCDTGQIIGSVEDGISETWEAILA